MGREGRDERKRGGKEGGGEGRGEGNVFSSVLISRSLMYRNAIQVHSGNILINVFRVHSSLLLVYRSVMQMRKDRDGGDAEETLYVFCFGTAGEGWASLLMYSLFQKKYTFNSEFFCGPLGEGGQKITRLIM